MNLGQTIARTWRRLRGQPEDPHQEQLLRLYWNRAELKKELSLLQDERHGILGKLDAQQAAIRRSTEQLEELAAYLGRPEIGTQALLYFQLRALWLACNRKLSQLASDLRQQQEERERRKHALECAAQRAAQVAQIEERLLNAQSIADSLAARRKLLSTKLAATKGFWKFRARRDLQAQVAQVQAQWEIAATNATDLSDERAAVAGAALEEYAGLSLEGKRIVNTAIIAYAEWLIVDLPNRTLAPLARQAISAQIYDANLGTVQQCERLMAPTKIALAALADTGRSLLTLKEFIDRVRARAVYRGDRDTVPLANSLGEVPLSATTPAVAGRPEEPAAKANVLVDDYWSIAQVLLQ